MTVTAVDYYNFMNAMRTEGFGGRWNMEESNNFTATFHGEEINTVTGVKGKRGTIIINTYDSRESKFENLFYILLGDKGLSA